MAACNILIWNKIRKKNQKTTDKMDINKKRDQQTMLKFKLIYR
jgi:hypothetical protein